MVKALTTTMEKPKKPMKSRYSVGLRSVSLIIVVAFLLQDFASAQGGTPIWQNVADAKSRTAGTVDEGALNKISIPYESGLARKVVVKGTDDLIINIQDAHSKLGAQESITRILDNLVKNYDLNLIALEGASDRVDTSLVSSFPIEEARKKAGEYLLKEGKISAGEFYSMIAQQPVKLYGVDDPELYKENLDAFKALVDKKLEVRDQLKGMKKAIRELESKVYSPALLEMSNRRLLQKNGDIKFTEYWEHFKKLADENGVDYRKYENLKKLSDTVALEKEIDFKAAGVERDRLITELGTKLPKPELEKLVLQALQFKQNKITPGTFHYTLSKMAEAGKADPERYPNIIRYSAYVVLYENIDLIAIFDEVEAFENEIRAKLFTNADEQALADLSHCVMILSQLLDTTLSSKDYEFFVSNEASCEIDAIRDSFQALGEKYRVPYETYADFAVLKASIPNAKKFYELADRRNKALMENTVKRMRSEGVHVAALITGGFHSEGISKLMDDERLSYLVVMPKFDDKSPNRPYIAILTQKPREYEEAFKDSDFYLAAAMTFNQSAAMINTKYNGKDVRGRWEADMIEALGAALIGARLAAGVGTFSDDFKEQFLANLKKYQADNPAVGEFHVTDEIVRKWLQSTTRVNKQGDRLEVIVNGRKLYTIVKNGVMGPIKDGGPAESEEAVSISVSKPAVKAEDAAVSEADVRTLMASVKGNRDLESAARAKGFGGAIVKAAAARLAEANEASILKAISDAETLEKVTEIFHDANTRGMGSQAVRDGAMKRRLTLIPEAIKKASSIEEAEAILKSETYQLPVFVNDTEIRAALDAKREEIRQRDAKRIADVDAETARLVSERVRAIQGAETRDALETALNSGPANIAKLPSVVKAYRAQAEKLAAAETQAKVRDLIALIEETAKSADAPAALGDLTKDIPFEIVTDAAVQDAVAKARAAILKRAAQKREAAKPAAAPAPQAVPAIAPAPVSNADVQRQAQAMTALITKIRASTLDRMSFLRTLTTDELELLENKAVKTVLDGKQWADAPEAKPAAAAVPAEVKEKAEQGSRDAQLSEMWGAIRDAKDIPALAEITQRAMRDGLYTAGIKKYLTQRTGEIRAEEQRLAREAKTAAKGLKPVLSAAVAGRFDKDASGKSIGLEARVRDSLKAQGRTDAEIDRMMAEQDWTITAGELDKKNAKAHRDGRYGPAIEKVHYGDVWRKAKQELLSEGKIDLKKWGKLAVFPIIGRTALHLFSGFYLRHPGSAIRYHWFGEGKISYLSADETVKTVLDSMASQQAVRAGPRAGLSLFFARAAQVIRKAAEVTLVAAHFRFLTERASLYIISTIVVGTLIKFAALHPAVLIPVALLYIYAAYRYAPDKTDAGARRAHWFRMSIIPGLAGIAALASLFTGVPVLQMNLLSSLSPSSWASLPILKVLIGSGSLHAIVSPLATVFIRSFARESRVTRRQMIGAQTFGLPFIENGKFTKADGTQAAWSLDGMTVALYLEAVLGRTDVSAEDAGKIGEVLTAAIEHDAVQRISYNRVLDAGANDRTRIIGLLKTINAKRAMSFDPAAVARYRAAMAELVKRAGFEARRNVYSTGNFWKRLLSGWFSMWFVNTEISLVLSQMHLFDMGLSKAASAVSGSDVELHVFTPMAQVIEGANEDHPIARTGISIMPTFLEDFAESGGLLGSFNTLVNGVRETVDKDFAAEQKAMREAAAVRAAWEAQLKAIADAEAKAKAAAQTPGPQSLPDGEMTIPDELFKQAPGRDSLPDGEMTVPDELMPKEEPKAPEVTAFPAPEPMRERVPVAGDVDVDAVLAKFDLTQPRADVVKAVEGDAVKTLSRDALKPIVVLAIDKLKSAVLENPNVDISAFAVYVARVVRDANQIAAQPGITAAEFNRQMGELYGVAFPEAPAAAPAPQGSLPDTEITVPAELFQLSERGRAPQADETQSADRSPFIRYTGDDAALKDADARRARDVNFERLDAMRKGQIADAPLVWIYSVEKEDAYNIVRGFKTQAEAEKLMTMPSTTTRIFRTPVDGSSDITEMTTRPDKWTELTKPSEIARAFEKGDPVTVYVEGVDENGKPFKGVIEGGIRAAQESYQDLLAETTDLFKYRNANLILAIGNPSLQARAFAQRFTIDVPAGSVPYAAMRFELDPKGHMAGITELYPSNHISFAKDSRGQMQRVIETSRGKLFLHYWPYAKDGATNLYLAETAEEHDRRYVKGIYDDDPRFNLPDGKPSGFIMVGANHVVQKEMEAAVGVFVEERNTQAAGEFVRYLKVKTTVGIISVPLTIFLSPLAGTGANLLTDLIMRPDLIGRPPSQQELQAYLLRAGYRPGNFTAADEERLLGYLYKNRKDSEALYLLGIAAGAGNMAAHTFKATESLKNIGTTTSPDGTVYTISKSVMKQSDLGQVVNAVFNNPYFSINGDVNLMNIASSAIGSRALESIAGYVGISFNIFEFMRNQRTPIGYKSDASGQGFYPIHKGTYPHLTIMGFDPHQFVDISNAQKVLAVRRAGQSRDPRAPRMYIFEESFLGGRMMEYSREDFKKLQKFPVNIASAGGESVPVWMVMDTLDNGQKYYYFAVLTEAGAQDILDEAKQDTKIFMDWLKLQETGGYIRHTGTQGGTIDQRTPTRLLVSHDFVAPGYPSAAFTFDQALYIVEAVLAPQPERAAEILGHFERYREVNMRHGGSFTGFLAATDAVTDAYHEGPTPGTNAMLGIAAIIEAKRASDPGSMQVARAAADWLVRQVQAGGGAAAQNANTRDIFAEPNAIVYAFLKMYASAAGDRSAQMAANQVLGTFQQRFWDRDARLVRNDTAQNDYSADAQTRWMLAMGTDDFARFTGGADEFWKYLERVESTFSFSRDWTRADGTIVKGLTLLDLATKERADKERKPNDDGTTRRVGFPEVTAEFALSYKKAAETFRRMGREDLAQKALARAEFFTKQIESMIQDGRIPQSTRPGSKSGFGYRTALGRAALASRVQYDLMKANFNMLNDPRSQVPAVALPRAQATAVLGETEGRWAQAVGDPAERASIEALLDGLVSGTHKGPEKLLYWDEQHGQEAVYVDAQGRTIHLWKMNSNQTANDYQENKGRALKEFELLIRATTAAGSQGPQGAAGEAGPAGAVIFNDPVTGRAIADKAGERVHTKKAPVGNEKPGEDPVQTVLKWIDAQSPKKQAEIMRRNFAGFEYETDADGDGRTEKVRATLFFPKGQTLTREWTDPATGVPAVQTFVGGRRAQTATDFTVTRYYYDGDSVPVRTETFRNVTGNRAEPAIDPMQHVKQTITLERRFYADEPAVPTDADMVKPRLVEIARDGVTGAASLNVYGLYAQPVRTVDLTTGKVTDNTFDPETGRITAWRTSTLANKDAYSLKAGYEALVASLTDNGVPEPQTGALRSSGRITARNADGSTVSESVEAESGVITVITRDAFGREKTSTKDGRTYTPSYAPDFHMGLVPKTIAVTAADGTLLETWVIKKEGDLHGELSATVTNHIIPGRVEIRDFTLGLDEPIVVTTDRVLSENHFDADGRVDRVTKTVDSKVRSVETRTAYNAKDRTATFEVKTDGQPDRTVTRDFRGRETVSVTRTERTSAVTENIYSDAHEQGFIPQTYTVNGESDGVKSLWADGKGLPIGQLGAFVSPAALAELQKNFGPLGAVRQKTREHIVEGSTVKAADEVLVFDELGRAVVRVNLTALEIEVLQTDGSTRVSKIEAQPDGSYIAAAEALYLVKDGKPITINGVTYPTKMKVDPKTGRVERVFAVGAFGTEKVRVTMLTETEAEAELIIDGKKSDIYDLTMAGDGTYTATKKPTFTVVSQGPLVIKDRTFDVKLRRSVDGAAERLFAVDGDGVEKVRITMFSADEGEAELVNDEEHSDIFKAKMIDGRFSIYGDRIGYTEGVPLDQVLTVKPESLKDVARAAKVYRLNEKSHKFEWSETLLLESKNDYVAVITPDPLYFTADKQVVDVFKFASEKDKRRGTVSGRDTYVYDSTSQTVGDALIGTSTKADPAAFVDLNSNSAIKERLDRPGVSFFKIEDKRRGISWHAFFDTPNRSTPIGRVQNNKLYVPKTENGIVQDGDDTYELLSGNKVGHKIFSTEPNTSVNRTVLIRELKAHGFDDAAAAVDRSKIFDIKALDPNDPTERTIKHFIGVFDKYQELIKIDVDLLRASVKFFDQDKPWIERSGLDLDYENGKLGELLGLSVVLNPLSDDPKELKQVFALDTAGKSGIIEYRERADGTPLMKEDVKYHVDLNNKNVEKLDRLIRTRNWDELNTEIRKGWNHFTRIVSEFGEFTNTGKGDGRYFSEAYLRSMAVPVRSFTEFWVPDPAAGDDKEKGKWEKDPQNILGGKEPMTRSELGRLEVVPGMTRIWVLREDRIPNVGRTEGSGEPTAISKYTVEVWDGAGNKVRSQFGHTKGSSMRERFENYDTELDLILFFFRGENDLHRPYHGKYKVADKSIVIEWRYDEKTGKNQPYVSGLANSTDILESGPVLFAAQRGYSETPLTTTDYDKLGDLLKHGQIKLDHVLVSNKEIKNRPGHLKVILEGYEIDQKTGFARDKENPEFITFLEDSDSYVQLFHVGVAPGGYTYEFDPSKGIEVEHYAPRLADGQHRDWDHTKWVARSTNLHFVEEENIPTYGKSAASGERFQKEWTMDYDVIDHREGMQGLKHITIRLDGRPAWMEFLKAGNNSAAIQRTHLDGSGIPSYVTTVDGETGKEVLYARIKREFDPVYKGYLWAYKKTVDNMESINEEGLSLFFNGHEILYWQDLFAGGVVNEKAPYVPSTKNSYLDRFLFLPLEKMTGTDDKRAYFEERRARIANDPDSFINKTADDTVIPPALIRTDTIRPAYFKATPSWLRALDPTTWDFKIGGFRVPWFIAAFGLPILIFFFGVKRSKRKSPAPSEAALQVTAPDMGARPLAVDDLKSMEGLGTVEAFIEAYRNRMGRTDQAETHARVFEALQKRNLLTIEHIRQAVLYLEQHPAPTASATAYEFYRAVIGRIFTPVIDLSFDEMSFNDASNGTQGVIAQKRTAIRDNILHDLSQKLAVHPDFLNEDLSINRPEIALIPKGQYLTTGHETADTVRTWVWREALSQPTSTTGMFGEMAGRSRLLDFMVRGIQQRIAEPKTIRPFIATYVKLWHFIIPAQGQGRNIVNKGTGAPRGLLLELRDEGAVNFYEKIGIRPGDLFTDLNFDDLYRYYQNPLVELMPRIKQELSEKFGLTIEESDETKFVEELLKTLKGLDRTKPEHARYFKELIKDGDSTKWLINMPLQAVATLLSRAVEEKVNEENPVMASLAGKTGVLNLYKKATMALPFHVSSDGWKAFFAFWGKAELAKRSGKLGIRDIIKGVSTTPFQRKFYSNENPNGASGRSAKSRLRFWASTVAIWSIYVAGLFGAISAFLYGFTVIVGGFTLTTVFAWVASMVLLGFFAIVTYPAVTMIAFGVVGLQEGKDKKVAKVGYWSLWGWPVKRMVKAMHEKRDEIEPVSGRSYGKLLSKLADLMYDRSDISAEERDAIKDGSFRTKSGQYVRVRSPMAREFFKQFINTIYIDKPGLESWEKLMSLTQLISSSDDSPFAYSYDQILAKGGQDGRDTKLHYLATRRGHRNEYENFLAYVSSRYGSADAVALIEQLKNLQTNVPVSVVNPADADVRGVLTELEKWFNRRQYTNFRLIESLTYVQDSYMDYAENYFYDEEYQAARFLLTGDRIYRGAAPAEPAAGAAAPPFASLKDAYRAAAEGRIPAGIPLTPDQIAHFISVYDYYKARADEKLQVILREDGLAGQLTFNKEGKVSSFGLAENVEKTLAALENTGYVRPAGVPKLAKWSKDADGKDKVDSIADFEEFAPHFDRVVESLNGLLANIRAELRPVVEAGIASKDPDKAEERLRLLALLEERVNFSLNDHLTNLYKSSILEYKTYIEILAKEYGFTAELNRGNAWKQLGLLAPVGVMENITKLRDYSKAQTHLSANGMEYFKASKADILEGSKYGGWGRVLHHARGQILQGIDSLQEVQAIYAPRILNVMTEFSRDPRLAIFLNGIQGNTEFFSMASGGAFFSESTWNLVSQRAKQAVDVLGLYGKGFLNSEYIKRYEGLQTDPVSEDIVTAIQFMNFGLRTKFGEYFQMGWRTAANLLIYTNPSGFKYPSGQAEYQMVLSRVFDRFLLNPNLPVSFKLGLMFNSWFYYKKPFVLGTIVAFVIIAQVLKWNLFVTLPYAALWTLIGALLAESINVSAFVRAWERDGYVKGTVMTLITVFRHMPMFVLNFFSNTRGNFEGARARSKFIPTSKAGELVGTAQTETVKIGTEEFKYNVYGEVPFKMVNAREAFGQQIKWGSWLTVLLMAFMPLSAGVQGMWILYLLTVFYWVAAPFLYTSAAEMWTKAQRWAAGSTMLLLFTHPYVLARLWPTLPIQYNPLFAIATLTAVLSTKIGRRIADAFVYSLSVPFIRPVNTWLTQRKLDKAVDLTDKNKIKALLEEAEASRFLDADKVEARMIKLRIVMEFLGQELKKLKELKIETNRLINRDPELASDLTKFADEKIAIESARVISGFTEKINELKPGENDKLNAIIKAIEGSALYDAEKKDLKIMAEKKVNIASGARLAEKPASQKAAHTLVFGEGFMGGQYLRSEEKSGRPARPYSRRRLDAEGRPMDILNPTQLVPAMQKVGAEKGRVVFLAGRGATRDSVFSDYMIDNVLQVELIARAMRDHAPEAPVVLASSSFAYVYAKPSNGSMTFKEKDGDVMAFDLPDESTFAKLQNYLSAMADRIYSGEISAADRAVLKARMNRELAEEVGLPREWLGRDPRAAYQNAYALSKVLSEQALQNIKVRAPKADGRDALNYYILRLGNIYGEGQQPERAIRNFTTALLRYYLFGEPVRSTVFLPDLPRQYIDARDVSRFIEILLGDPTNAPGEIINVADDLEHVTARAIWYRIFKNAVLKRELRDFAEELDLLSVESKPQVPKVRLVMDTTRMEDKIARYNRSHPDSEFHLTRLDSGIDRVVAHEIGVLVKSLTDLPKAMADFKRTYDAADETARVNMRDLLARALSTAKQNKDTAAEERLTAMLAETKAGTGARLAEGQAKLAIGVRDFDTYDKLATDKRFSGARLELLASDADVRAFTQGARLAETRFVVDDSIEPTELLKLVNDREKLRPIEKETVLRYVRAVLAGQESALALPEPSAISFYMTDDRALWLVDKDRVISAQDIQDSLVAIAETVENGASEQKIETFARDFAAFAAKALETERAAALNGVSARFVETLLEGNIDSRRTVAVNVRGLSPEREQDLIKQKTALESKGAKVVFTNYATLAAFKSEAAANNWSGIFLSGDAAMERKITDPPVMAIDPKAESVEGAVAVAYRVALLNGDLSVYIPGLRQVNNILIFMPIRQVLAEIMRQAVTTREATGVSA